MDDRTFEALTRRAAEVVSRRGSLRTLSAAALSLGVAGPAASAKKGGKKNDKCKKQVSRCKQGLADLCDVLFPPQEAFSTSECSAAFGDCCEFLSDCNVSQAFACAIEVVESLQAD